MSIQLFSLVTDCSITFLAVSDLGPDFFFSNNVSALLLVPDAPPHEALWELMRSRGLKQRDLLGIFGSDGIASEVVNGKRNISRAHAKSLAEYFHVPVELFT